MSRCRFILLLCLPGCMATGQDAISPGPICSVPPTASVPVPSAGEESAIVIRAGYTPSSSAFAGVVFVANGSGDSSRLSTNLTAILAQSGTPLQVQSVSWSHGQGRVMADHWDQANQKASGKRLAAQVAQYSATHPGQPIYLMGHSSGCSVILAAAESLPPGSVERIILLAPSVCSTHDLRPALWSSRGGIDSFYSSQDRLVLGFGMAIVSTTDGDCRGAAGLYGFQPVIRSPQDAGLYQRLRQHPWNQTVVWTGNDGNHYGPLHPKFLQAYVVPVMLKR